MAKYICKVREHHHELFAVKLGMDIRFAFWKKSFNLISEFIQTMKATASLQPTNFGIKQESHMFCSHFFGQNLEKPVIFSMRTDETSIISINCGSRVLNAKAYRCNEQCEEVT